MVIHQGMSQHIIHTLLDSGCLVLLISKTLIEQLNIPQIWCQETTPLRNYLGEEVPGVGEEYTKPLLLQH